MGIKKLFGLAICLILAAAASAQQSRQPPVKTVDSVDLQRYQGKWYEIAKYPNRFQKKCAANTTATYSLKGENRISVVNQCRDAGGKTVSATGEAKVVEGSSNSKLKVRFAPSFLPFVWGDYWIIDLDPAYAYAAIGSPDRRYLWILSRSQTLDDSTYEAILKRAESQGFHRSKVLKTAQD